MTSLGSKVEGTLRVLAHPSDTAKYGSGDIVIGNTLDVDGITTLDQTTIDTTDGVFSVSGSNAYQITSTAASTVSTTGSATLGVSTATGALTVQSTGSTTAVTGNQGITVTATNNNAVIDAVSGSVTVDGDSGVNVTASTSGNATLNSAAGDSSVTGGSGSMTVTNAGGIDINATTGDVDITGTTSVDIASGTDTTVTTTAGVVQITAAGGNVEVTSDQQVLIDSTGTGGAGGVEIQTTDLTNGINIGTDAPDVPITIGNGNNTTTIAGNLNVTGTTTTVNTEDTTIADNLFVVNSAAIVGRDGGFLVQRTQTDVLADSANETSTYQAGSTGTTIVLNAGANASDDYYNGWYLTTTSGAATGETVQITDYVGATQTATVDAAFSSDPASGDAYELRGTTNAGFMYDESADEFVLTYTGSDPDNPVQTDRADLRLRNLTIEGTISGGSIAGQWQDTTVSLLDNASTAVAVTGTNQQGSYLLIVKSQASGGATATFACSCNADGTAGQVVRLTTSDATTDEELDADWNTSSGVTLFHDSLKTGGVGASLVYDVKYVGL